MRDLAAHRTLGLRLALGEHPKVALIAVPQCAGVAGFLGGRFCLANQPALTVALSRARSKSTLFSLLLTGVISGS
ncbi:hypothetical protein [Azorhizobium sp. AG788]|uniref:hypothetical protein n=1 Tax=Azorhizobium sp. AG788 TaxID=2183897 RepID=UPI0010611452|nr:hypothetical protein [Azorhizobium sp. AG788]